jgi:drug/metabolite transporter (DMT)-like permease
MNIIFPILLSIITAFLCLLYERVVKTVNTLFVTALINSITTFSWCVFLYFKEGTETLTKAKLIFTNYSIIIPYFILNILYYWLWFYTTHKVNATYTSIFESLYIIFMVIINIYLLKQSIDVKFIIGVVLVIAGVFVIQSK